MTSLPNSYTLKSTSSMLHVLVVSANPALREDMYSRLGSSRWAVDVAGSGAEALDKLSAGNGELLLLDPALPDLDAAEFRNLVQGQHPYLEIVSVNPQTGQPFTSNSTPRIAPVLALLEKQMSLQNAAVPLCEGNDTTRSQPLPGMVGDSEVMRKVYSTARMVAKRETTVLIAGESGTGKDLLAQGIHALSPRHSHPFVVINCAAIPEALLEAELFGYVKGAFTGAIQSRIGRIHAAHGGTLFLDEIGDMPLALQAKLLRFLEQGEVQRLGSTDNFRVDVRVVAATNAALQTMVKQKQFREDLYYRLNVFPIQLPPLREHREDIRPLATSFLTRYCHPNVSLSSEALAVMQEHNWPGNVRELRNVMERASILIEDGREISAQHIVI